MNFPNLDLLPANIQDDQGGGRGRKLRRFSHFHYRHYKHHREILSRLDHRQIQTSTNERQRLNPHDRRDCHYRRPVHALIRIGRFLRCHSRFFHRAIHLTHIYHFRWILRNKSLGCLSVEETEKLKISFYCSGAIGLGEIDELLWASFAFPRTGFRRGTPFRRSAP